MDSLCSLTKYLRDLFPDGTTWKMSLEHSGCPRCEPCDLVVEVCSPRPGGGFRSARRELYRLLYRDGYDKLAGSMSIVRGD